MNGIKNKWLLLLVNIGTVIVIAWFTSPGFQLEHYINVLFYVTSFYLFIGFIMYVIYGKFFDAITLSFQRVGKTLSKSKDYLEDIDDRPLPSEIINKNVLTLFLFQGVSLLFILLALLYLYYQ
ncbi:DUF3899 domain-containing protein [Salirhabdus salicampi]|uniref:DUF3899 domain-containing protein n=1 Tax=Salirhabdus salicampi TaxID=476102 RepID=UPI003F591AB1